MRLTASDTYSYYRPSRCSLRVYLRGTGETETEPSPYQKVLRRLGKRHEEEHLASLPDVLDLRAGERSERFSRTKVAVNKRTSAIYQPVLMANWSLCGLTCEIVGEPDFLIREGDGFLVRDSKVSRRISKKDHPEILHQLELYGWLFQQVFGMPPVRLEVHSGAGEIVPVAYDGGAASLAILEEIVSLKRATAEPYSPVGWSKCAGCGYFNRCWPRAEAGHQVALVSGVDQGLARALNEDGINTLDEFLASFDEQRLADYQRPWGRKTQKVGNKAGAILKNAQAMCSGKEILLQAMALPSGSNYVVFDVEGLPPHLDETGKTYLWGLQVFGTAPGPFLPATAGFGTDGDRQGWKDFLRICGQIFVEHGDLPFLHWGIYEQTQIDAYVKQHGDPDGVAARVRRNLVDLHSITKQSVALPLPSYSLKVIEKHIGFARSQDEYGGDWAMAKYIEAAETGDEELRKSTVDQIIEYNREDLEATWAVFQWLRAKAASAP